MSTTTLGSEKTFSYKKTFLIGLGFFTTGISWALYNSYVPLWLNTIIPDRWIVGLIMGIDNLAMIVMEPLVGTYSDRTRTRFGRRVPYMIIGIPIAAIFLTLMPIVKDSGILALMAVIISFLLMMAFYRAPVVALMPDVVSSKHRSKANGVINLMGGLGSVYAFLFGSILYKIDPLIAFGSTAVIMILALILIVAFVKEDTNYETLDQEIKDSKAKHGIRQSINEVFIQRTDNTGIFILFAIFFWFFGWNALETWFTSWATTNVPHIIDIANSPATIDFNPTEAAESAASFMLTVFAFLFVLLAIPGGLLGQKIGRAKTIKIGIPIMIVILILTWLIGQFNILNLDPNTQYYAIIIVLGMGAVGWACININSIVIVWEIATDEKLGSYTGLYYLFSSSAAVLGPGIVGLIFDVFSGGEFYLLFPVSTLSFVIAFIMMLGVKSGETKT